MGRLQLTIHTSGRKNRSISIGADLTTSEAVAECGFAERLLADAGHFAVSGPSPPDVQCQPSKILPISSEIDTDRGIVLTRLDGVVPEDEVEDHNKRLGEDPRFKPHYRQLVDLTGMTEIAYDTGAVKRAAEKHVFAPGARRAIVAPSDAAFGMSRMWAIQSEPAGQRIEVFREIEAAKAWLGW